MKEQDYIRMYKKSPANAMAQVIADWGREIYAAHGRQKQVDAAMAKYLRIESRLADLCEFSKGYKADHNWMQCAIAQSVPAQATVAMFDQYRLNYPAAQFPTAKGAETIERIDISEELGTERGTIIVRIKLIPVEGFPAGSIVRSKRGKLFEVSTREPNGMYRIVAQEKSRKGTYTETILTDYQITKMERVA